MNDIFRLGVLADTHLLEFWQASVLADQLVAGPFSQVDAILHAGDMTNPDLEFCFTDIPFYAVQGNMDEPRSGLSLKRVIEFGSYRIGLIHGWGAPGAVAGNVHAEFAEERLDVLVFGHSHTPFLSYVGERLLFNPGSATDHRGHAAACSVGLLELGDKIDAKHVYFE